MKVAAANANRLDRYQEGSCTNLRNRKIAQFHRLGFTGKVNKPSHNLSSAAAAAMALRPRPDLTILMSSSSLVSEVDASSTISPECRKLMRSHTSKTWL